MKLKIGARIVFVELFVTAIPTLIFGLITQDWPTVLAQWFFTRCLSCLLLVFLLVLVKNT